MKLSKRNVYLVLLVSILLLPAITGLLWPGYFSVHDAMHPAWVFEMYQAVVASNQFPPRWAPDLSFGYGYPLFHFIYPLPYYLATLFYILGASLTFSVEIVTILAIIASFIFMYLWSKQLVGRKAALIASLVYVYTPYRALDIYVRGALGETVGFAFLALLGYGITRLVKKTDLSGLLTVAMGVATLILSHNLMAYLGLIFFVLYSLVLMVVYKKKLQFLIWLVGGIGLGVLTSAYFWIPALIDKHLMVDDTVFNFVDHFPFIYQLIIPSWGHGVSLWGLHDGLSFQIGIINLFIVLIAILISIRAVLRKKWERKFWLWWFIILVFTGGSFMMNIRSMFVWNALPLGMYFQFPWRMLIITTFSSAFLAGLVVDKLKISDWKFLFLSLIIVGGNFYYFVNLNDPRVITRREIFEEFFAKDPLTNGGVSKKYLDNTEEYLRLPKITRERPKTQKESKIEVRQGLKLVSVRQINPVKWDIRTKGRGELVIHVYNLPGWRGKINGVETELSTDQPWGQIKINVDGNKKDEDSIEVFYTQPRSALVANKISGFSLIFAGLLFYYKQREEN